MISVKSIREERNACIRACGGDLVRGSNLFLSKFQESLGVTQDEYGQSTIAPNSIRASEYSLRDLADAIIGYEYVRENMNPLSSDSITSQRLTEAGPGIDPTAFQNINTWSIATGGLVNAQIIEKSKNPEFIGDQLVTVQPTRMNGEKMIGVTGIGNKAQSRKPGEPHPIAGFGEHYIMTPELDEKALAVEVTQEAVFYDLTGQVMDTAAGVGEELGYLRELEILRLVIGATNSYNYNGTSYNTYQTSTPWINKFQNVLEDYTDIDAVLQKFSKMTDPATGKEILVSPNTILHMPALSMTVNRILRATEVRTTTNTNTVSIAPNPAAGVGWKTLSSPILLNVATAASPNGLGLSESNANNNTWVGDFKGAFRWMEAWPLRVRSASPSEYTMLNRGLLAAYFANYRGAGAVREPRKVVQNTH